jgi:ABC-type uncharacterized transport system substrate-binding protein
MKFTKNTFLGRLLQFILLLPLYWSSHSYAHPHSFINLKTEFSLDDQGQLSGLIQHWEFDVYYSMITYADMMNDYGNEQKGLLKLGQGMVNSLKSYAYFSNLEINGRLIQLGTPYEQTLSITYPKGQQTLTLTMHFEIDKPQAIENKTISFRVFDPSYYIDMRHYSASQVIIHTKNATECSSIVELPETSDELVEYAASLDKNQKNTTGLGDKFAEKVTIHCL